MSAAPDLLARARAIQTATLFLTGFRDPEALPDFGALIDRLRALAEAELAPGDRFPLRFVPGVSAYPDFDPFRSIGVLAPGGAWLCRIADRWADDADRDAALAILRRAFA